MAYTLWSRGRLLGETDLGFVYRANGFRCGWFHPNELGIRCMPAATGVAPAMRVERIIGPDETARVDVLAAIDQEEALELELRGPDGTPIATESIGIVDTEYLLSIPLVDAPEDEDDQPDEAMQLEIDAAVEEFLADLEPEEPWRQPDDDGDLPRYQIQVLLAHHDAIP